MKYKSRGVSLTYIKHGESSIISKILTEERGCSLFLLEGFGQKKLKKNTLFRASETFNSRCQIQSKNSLQYLEDISIEKHFEKSSNKIYKDFFAIFIAEVNAVVLQENEQNKLLFNFIWNETENLYTTQELSPNFALLYLIKLSRFLGFYPSIKNINRPFFNLESGEFSENKTHYSMCLNMDLSTYLKSLLLKKETIIPSQKRSELLRALLIYFKCHDHSLETVTSHLIIESFKR